MKIKKTVKDLIYGKNIKTIKNYKYLADHLKKDSKILIIGGTGALGKTLIRRYQDDNKIMVFSRT